ncbi:MAG: endonuclease/exonuclease/phosphatase family protein [Paludibacteraceae bacterium]|nr:endonuclease/exonuclease/phosphatase family protein [Paludibacteraceae bacterium]
MSKAKHKRRGCLWRVIPSLIVLALLVWTGSLLFSHRQPQTEGSTRQLTVLTYNTHQMEMYTKAHQNRIIRYLQRQDVDVVCLQEVDVYKDDKYLTLPEMRKALDKYPYTYFDFKIYNKRHQYGIAVFSKYPLINKHTIRYTSRGNISNYCDLVVGTDTLRLFNNHLESNKLTITDLPDTLESEAIRLSAHRISDKLGSARAIRHEQARAIRQEIDSSPYPVIVAGDFNAIPLSYTYLKIRGSDLRDCFLESSVGHWGATLTKRHIGIRIDYVLCSPSLHPAEVRIDKLNYSDHYPVRATIKW